MQISGRPSRRKTHTFVVGAAPVQVDISEQPVLRSGALKVQAKLAAHPAVGAVGADGVVGGDGPRAALRLGDRGGDTAGIHPEAVEFGLLLDVAAKLADPPTEDGLGHVLRDVEHEAESRPVAGQFQTHQGLPSVYMWKRRTTWPCSTNRSARPIKSNTSSVRAWMPRARACSSTPPRPGR